eukprot:1319787-Amorphochlora_amoeboformis.AAC.1
MRDAKERKKQKTSVVKNTVAPVWNESLTFLGVHEDFPEVHLLTPHMHASKKSALLAFILLKSTSVSLHPVVKISIYHLKPTQIKLVVAQYSKFGKSKPMVSFSFREGGGGRDELT